MVEDDNASKRCPEVNIVIHGKSGGYFRRFVASSYPDKGHVVVNDPSEDPSEDVST